MTPIACDICNCEVTGSAIPKMWIGVLGWQTFSRIETFAREKFETSSALFMRLRLQHSSVSCRVHGYVKNFKILKAIVGLVAVDVMHVFGSIQFTRDRLLHNVAMLKNLFAIDLHDSVPEIVDVGHFVLISKSMAATGPV